MKLYGYRDNDEDIIELKEVSIVTSVSELKKLIKFIESTIESHNSVNNSSELCHSHLRDWDNEWQKDQPDIIIVTNL
jgi:hypothetical protein